MPSLFDPLKAGAIEMKNRVVMAPLTRSRAGESRVPNAMMAEYYAQRASAGLIVSEATGISPEGYGWRDAPAAYTDAHMHGWELVTDAVHTAGGKIVMQLWHMGRLSHSDLIGQTPLAPSAIAADGEHRSVHKPYEVPRAMTFDDIRRTIDDFAMCARRAIKAGFDGVEIHGANGYLIDQFLRDNSNTRTDQYGSNIEGRARFMKEIVQAVTAEVGADRTGIRLSPMNGYQSMNDSQLEATFVNAAKTLAPFNLAFLHIREAASNCVITPKMREVYKGVIIANDAYEADTAQAVIDAGVADAVAFGQKFISNPDLVERLRTGAPLTEINKAALYKGGAEGYTDYPFMTDKAA